MFGPGDGGGDEANTDVGVESDDRKMGPRLARDLREPGTPRFSEARDESADAKPRRRGSTTNSLEVERV